MKALRLLSLTALAFSLPTIAAAASVVLTSSSITDVLGQPVTLTATLTPGVATGNVTFYDGTTVIGTRPVANGIAALTTGLLPFGVRSLKAYYGGDSGNASATSPPLTIAVSSVPVSGFSRHPYATPLNNLNEPSVFSVASGDFNGDGKVDLVAANLQTQNISILLGNGNGTFQQPVNYATLGSPLAVAVGDFNVDGKLDIVVGYSASGGGGILFGNGDGTFRSPVTYAAGAKSSFVAVGDFNSDGKPDLAVANPLSNNVSILLGNGDGAFQPAVNYAVGVQPGFIAVADFNRDGKADLVVANSVVANSAAANSQRGTISVLSGKGDGTFGAAVNISATYQPGPVAVGDLNGDSIADLVVSDLSFNAVWVFLGNGDGTFQQPQFISPSIALQSEIPGTAIGDFDGDGRADIFIEIQARSSLQVVVALGKGDGTFVPRPPVISTTGLTGFDGTPGAIELGDFNGDGRTDFALAEAGALTLFVGLPGQTIAFAPLSDIVFGSGTLTLTATASSGLPVAYSSGTKTVCAVSGTTVTILTAGKCLITASQAGDNSTYSAATSVTQSFTIKPAANGDGGVPQPTGGIANAASAGQAQPSVVSLGSYIAIYGSLLAGNGSSSATVLPLPTTLNGTQVSLGGKLMPLLYASAGQINGLVPQGLTPGFSYPLVVSTGSVQSAPITLLVKELQPGIYTVDTSGSGPGIVTNALTGQLINLSNPAHASDFLVIYGTGLGPVKGPNGESGPGDGAVAPANLVFSTTAKVTATIGGVTAQVLFSGLTPTFAGLYQVNVQVPAGVAAGSAVPLVVTAPDSTGVIAQSNSVTIAVQ